MVQVFPDFKSVKRVVNPDVVCIEWISTKDKIENAVT